MKTITIVMLSAVVAGGCEFEPLEPAGDVPGETDDLAGAVTIEGIQVLPAVIHAGDEVRLHDPVTPKPTEPVPLYYWDACTGAITQPAPNSRDATWVAPPAPGAYSITVNITNAERAEPSRVLSLCVAPDGANECADEPAAAPTLRALVASPASQSCSDVCEATLDADTVGAGLRHQWITRRGTIIGDGASVVWKLPVPGCCPERVSAALTVCAAAGGAATGAVSVEVLPE